MTERLSARAARRIEQQGERRQEARRHAPDGGSQPRLLALSLVRPATAKEFHQCPAPIRSRTIATSASWRTSMPARRRRPSASSITPARATRSARCTTAPRPWTGWSRSRSAASPSPPPRPPRSGTASASTSSTRPATSTSPSRWSARCACSTARYACSIPTRASSRRPRRSGARATATTSRASCSATRWTRSARTSSSA